MRSKVIFTLALVAAAGCSTKREERSVKAHKIPAELLAAESFLKSELHNLPRAAIATLRGMTGAEFEARFHGWNKWRFFLWDEDGDQSWKGLAVLMARDRFGKPIKGLMVFHDHPVLAVPLRCEGDVAHLHGVVRGKKHPTLTGEMSEEYKAFLEGKGR